MGGKANPIVDPSLTVTMYSYYIISFVCLDSQDYKTEVSENDFTDS